MSFLESNGLKSAKKIPKEKRRCNTAKRRITFDERFARHGLKIFAKVPDSDFGGRGKSIQEFFDFLKTQGKVITHFAILDDNESDYAKAKLSDHLVKISFYRGGLTKAIALFNQRHAFCDGTIFNCPFRWTLLIY